MAHLLRSRLVFSLIVASLVLFLVLLATPLAAPYGALAATAGEVDALNVEKVGSYGLSTLGYLADRVVVVENRAYLVSNFYDFNEPYLSRNVVDQYDISNPQSPQLSRSFAIGENHEVSSEPGLAHTISDLVIEGTTAYLAVTGRSRESNVGEFLALDLQSTPPSKICAYFFTTEQGRLARDVSVQGQYAYVGTDTNVTVLDTSDVDSNGHCKNAGAYATNSSFAVRDIERVGNLLYVAVGDGFQILSIANPVSPSFVASFTTPRRLERLAVNAAGYVFASSDYEVFIIDASDTNFIRLWGTYTSDARSVTVDGSRLYVGTSIDGLRVVDASDPTAPVEVGHYVDNTETSFYDVYDVFVADGYIHTPDGIFRYRPDGPEPCPQSRGPDPCRPLEFKVTHPTVQINNQPVAVDNSQPLRPGDQITLGAPKGAGETRVLCHQAQYFVALARFADSEEEGPGEISVLEIAAYHEELVQKFCTSPPRASAQGGESDLVFTLESGDVQAQGEVPNLLLNIGTTSATVQSTGMNIFNVAHLSDTDATTVGALNGTVQVVPTNSALPPVTLQRNQQITVTNSEVSPVTPYGSSVFLPLALSAD